MAMADNLWGYWKLDETTGTTADDAFSTHDGTLSGGSVNSTGIIGKAYHLTSTGSENKITFGNKSFTVLTWNAWVYLNTSVQYTNNLMMSRVTSTYQPYLDYRSWGDATGSATSKPGCGAGGTDVRAASAMTKGAWHMLTFTWTGDTTANGIKLYVDGSFSAQGTAGTATQNGSEFWIGKSSLIGNENSDYLVDEVGVWERVLSSTEITALYNSGAGLAYPWATNYTQACTDSLTVSSSGVKTTSKPRTDALHISASATKLGSKTRADSFTISTSATKTGSRKFSSSFTLTDALSRAATLKRSAVDSITIGSALLKTDNKKLVDALSIGSALKRDTRRTFSSSFTMADAKNLGYYLSLADDMELYENAAFGRIVVLADLIEMEVDMVRDIDKLVTESIGMSSTPTQLIEMGVADEFNLTDTLEALRAKIVLDTLAVQDSIDKLYTGYREYSDSLTVDSNLTKITNKPLSDALTEADAFKKDSSKPVTDNLFIGSEVFKADSKILNEGITEADSKAWTFGRPVTDAIDMSDGVLKDSQRLFSDNLAVTDAVYKTVSKEFAEVLTLAEDLLASKIYYEFLADVFGLSDVLTKEVRIARSDVYTLADASYKDIARAFSDAYGVDDEIIKQAILDKIDYIIMNDGTAGKSFVATLADIFHLSDEAIRTRALYLADEFNTTEANVSWIPGKWLADTFNMVEAAPTFVTKNAFSKFRAHLDYIFTSIPFAEEVTWTRYSNTEDELGRASAITQVFSENISLIVQPLVDSDRSLLPQGVQISGYMKAYSKDSYAVTGLGYLTPDIGDQILLYNGKKYLVDSVQGKWVGRSEIYRKIILKRIDND